MSLEIPYADGQLAALTRYKLGWPAPTNPTVANSAVLRGKAAPASLTPDAMQNMAPPTTPFSIARESGQHERLESQNEPLRKLSVALCTSCRKDKHYGTCRQPRAIPVKSANFNPGMHGGDPSQSVNDATHANYHSAVSSVNARTRTSEGRPHAEQAASGFADLFRNQGINIADEPGRMYEGLNKVAKKHKLAAFLLPGSDPHPPKENRGPAVNPYEEQHTRLSPPYNQSLGPVDKIDHMFRAFDTHIDTANVGGGSGDPQPGPAALG
jgi:hypothetical protein